VARRGESAAVAAKKEGRAKASEVGRRNRTSHL